MATLDKFDRQDQDATPSAGYPKAPFADIITVTKLENFKKTLVYIVIFTLIPSVLFAAKCPSPDVILQAMSGGYSVFDRRGNGVEDTPTGLVIVSKDVMGMLDKAAVGMTGKSRKDIPVGWKAPIGVSSNPEWKISIPLKRGIFGDGATYLGSTITYGGQVTCHYDFSDVSGLSVKLLDISAIGSACLPANEYSWKLKIPADRAVNAPAAFCQANLTRACALGCIQN